MPEITGETLQELEAETKGPKTLYETSIVAGNNAVSTFELMEETFSNFSKLIRVTAWILRFIRNLKHLKLNILFSSKKIYPEEPGELARLRN